MHKAAGSDGWRPYELRYLPVGAWEERRKVIKLGRTLHRSPQAYYHAPSPALPKIDKLADHLPETLPQATNHRILLIMTALYRVESGASYRQHVEWLKSWLHPALHGCIPGHECSDVSWDAQAHIEHAKLVNEHVTIFLLDYYKFF